jgi:hypothetical protein
MNTKVFKEPAASTFRLEEGNNISNLQVQHSARTRLPSGQTFVTIVTQEHKKQALDFGIIV